MVSVFNKNLFWCAILLCIVFLILGLIILANVNSGNQTSSITKANFVSDTSGRKEVCETQIIHFPKDRSMGMLYIGKLRTMDPHWWQGWELVGEAKGDMQVPIGKDVRLNVSTEASKDISPLASLGPNDIQVIAFSFARNSMIDDTGLAHLAGLTGLKQLGLSSTKIQGSGLIHLSKLKSLETLSLSHINLTDEGLKPIAVFKSLRRINLSYTQITDAGLAYLKDLDLLERLDLYGNNITGKGLSHLSEIRSLRNLYLNLSSITDNKLNSLSKLKSLEVLSLFKTNISDIGLSHIKNLNSIQELNLRRTRVTDAGLDYVSRLVSLESLSLPRGTTDAGLAKLKGLTKLKQLNIGHMQLTETGLERLKDFKSLESLELPKGISDEDIAVIKDILSLKELRIQASPITDMSMDYLAELKSLKKLLLHNVNISDIGYTKLTNLIDLEELRLIKTTDNPAYEAIGNEGLASVGKLKNLKLLELLGTKVTNGGLKHLSTLTSLQELYLAHTGISDAGLIHIGTLKTLKKLDLSDTNITDRGLVHLKELTSLKEFFAGNTHVSEIGISHLKEIVTLQTTRYSQKPGLRPEIGDTAPTFSGRLLDGKTWDLENYHDKVVLLHFWWTLCKPCITKLPVLKTMYEDLSKHKQFAMVSVVIDSESIIRNVNKKHGVSWPHIADGQPITRIYGTSSSPAYFIIGTDGRIVANDNLGSDLNKIKAAVLNALEISAAKSKQ